MSGETEADPSGWTPDQVMRYFSALRAADDRLLAEIDRRYEERFEGQEKANAIAREADVEQVRIALESAKEATSKTEVAFRTGLEALQAELRAGMESLGKAITGLELSRGTDEGKGAGSDRIIAAVVVVAGLMLTAAAIILSR